MRRVVGTSEGCDLRVSDAPYMSNRHFSITWRDDETLWVEDLGSTNGTDVYRPGHGWVKAFPAVRLVVGSKIYAGRVLFKFEEGWRGAVVRDVALSLRDSA